MNIQGLQKLTLLDWPGKVACTVFLGGCDFRCPFCHNSELISGPYPPEEDEEELMAFLRKRRGILDGVCITGGEPLLQPDLKNLLIRIKAMGYPIKLDTNGNHPKELKSLWEKGLVDYVAMDVKNSPAHYGLTAGKPSLKLDAVQESISWLMEGHVEYEFRTTVVKEYHCEQDFREIAHWIKGAEHYYLQAFADRDTVLEPGLHPCSREEMEHFADLVRPEVPSVQLRGI